MGQLKCGCVRTDGSTYEVRKGFEEPGSISKWCDKHNPKKRRRNLLTITDFTDDTGQFERLNLKAYESFDFYLSSEYKLRSLLTKKALTEDVLNTLIRYELATRQRPKIIDALLARYFKLMRKRLYKEMIDYAGTENRTISSETSQEDGRNGI